MEFFVDKIVKDSKGKVLNTLLRNSNILCNYDLSQYIRSKLLEDSHIMATLTIFVEGADSGLDTRLNIGIYIHR